MKKYNNSILFIILSLLYLVGCSRVVHNAPGILFFIAKDSSVTFVEIAECITSWDSLSIERTTSVDYHSNLSSDSTVVIRKEFESRNYIERIWMSIQYNDYIPYISISLIIKDFEKNNLEDYKSLLDRFAMQYFPHSILDGLILYEKENDLIWESRLEDSGLFEFVNYNLPQPPL